MRARSLKVFGETPGEVVRSSNVAMGQIENALAYAPECAVVRAVTAPVSGDRFVVDHGLGVKPNFAHGLLSDRGEWVNYTPVLTPTAGTLTGGTFTDAAYAYGDGTLRIRLSYDFGTLASASSTSIDVGLPAGHTTPSKATGSRLAVVSDTAGHRSGTVFWGGGWGFGNAALRVFPHSTTFQNGSVFFAFEVEIPIQQGASGNRGVWATVEDLASWNERTIVLRSGAAGERITVLVAHV